MTPRVLLLVGLVMNAVPCRAQSISTVPVLHSGETIRFQTESRIPFVEGRVRTLSGRTLVVEITPDRIIPLDLTTVSRLELSREDREEAGALAGALIGGFGAGILGAVWGWAVTQNPVGIHGGLEGVGVVFGIPAAAVGAFIGGIIGYNNPPHEWIPVSITSEPTP